MPFANPAQAKPKQAQPRQIAFDPAIAEAVAQRLAFGFAEEVICFQLKHAADEDVVKAYIREAQNNAFFKGAMVLHAPFLKRRWILNAQAESWRKNPDNRKIAIRENLSPEAFLAEHYANQRPAIIKGLVDDWPAMTLWNIDYLEGKVGRDTPIEVQNNRESHEDYERACLNLKDTVPFGTLADLLRSGEPSNDMYVTANNGAANRKALDPLWADFDLIEGYTKPDPDNDGFIWIGPKGTITPFHHDLTNNLLIQVKGRKRVVLVPNFEETYMQTDDRFFSSLTPDQMDLENGDKPFAMTFDIGPGDALFVPVGWWHHIVSLEECYSVLFTNFVWENEYRTGFPEQPK